MENLLSKSKHLILIAVIASFIASAAAFLLGAAKVIFLIINIVKSYGKDPLTAIALIEVMDTFLIAAALLIFAVGIYQLSIEAISLPEWLVVNNLRDFKTKLSSIAILIMVFIFIRHLVEWRDPQGTYYFGIAVALVSASLIASSHFGGKD
ncbi:MAG: YqhA family protein [Thermodesulfovibrionales bacterium]|nr:YqhA family protein [Thermodesulfovibrionales bacterium]